jgi:acetylornithine/succinyldiaminopimelate/putrescine aminotransferase
MHHRSSLIETCEQILREQEPNFLRLYLNPHVAQACFCLDRYVRTTWTLPPDPTGRPRSDAEDFQSFLANGLEEALSGAIKLARYSRPTPNGPPSTGLILDPADRLAGFVSAKLAGGGIVPFLPGLRVIGKDELRREPGTLGLEKAAENGRAEVGTAPINPLVLVAGTDGLLDNQAETIRRLVDRHRPLVITCVDRESLAALRGTPGGILREIAPDIIVFDESFTDRAVPFGAFTAPSSLFAAWNRPRKSTFHSTTFQPNTISTRHFMHCLTAADPDFHDRYRDELRAVLIDLSRRGDCFRRHYSPPLYRLIRAAGFNTIDVRAAGSFIVADGRSIFDTVGGVACSIRGHNPATYADEIKELEPNPTPDSGGGGAQPVEANAAVEDELRSRLRDLTGLECFLPAVSGATAVENALKLALVARFPRRHILALKAGFGGKTLLSLTGTANPSYKERIDPLYADVHYVDPFAPDALEQIDALLERHEFAVVQLELIQSVGGVRRLPESVVRHLDAGRKRHGYLLLVDEVQTGMYRTGPFNLSRTFDLTPDLLLLGKGTSDMMFPFALTLYSAAVEQMLERQGSDLADTIKRRYNYEYGYRTVVNVLRRCEESGVTRRVAEAAELFTRLLTAGLASSKFVRDIRVFGLLIGVELDTRRGPRRWLGKRLSALYLLAMLRHERFPVLAGFCQYVPNVLKITPPLNASDDEIRRACDTIIDVLGRPLHKVLAAALGGLIKSSPVRKKDHEHTNDPALELAAR